MAWEPRHTFYAVNAVWLFAIAIYWPFDCHDMVPDEAQILRWRRYPRERPVPCPSLILQVLLVTGGFIYMAPLIWLCLTFHQEDLKKLSIAAGIVVSTLVDLISSHPFITAIGIAAFFALLTLHINTTYITGSIF
ncbi:unnamed protein product, partial [Mesorhabditis spiculigera]